MHLGIENIGMGPGNNWEIIEYCNYQRLRSLTPIKQVQ